MTLLIFVTEWMIFHLYFFKFPKLIIFGHIGLISKNKYLVLPNPVLKECVIYRCPLNTDVMQVLNICRYYTKYYITQLLLINVLNLYTCMIHIKLTLEIECNICKSSNNETKFSECELVYDKL